MSLLTVRVTPRSSKNKIEVTADGVKVWVTAAPTDGQANEAVCRLIAKGLGIAPSKVTVARGDASRDKTLEIDGFSPDEAREALSRPQPR